MAYNATYASSDLSPIVTDIVGTGAVEIVNFVGLIVVLAIVTWLLVKVRGLTPR